MGKKRINNQNSLDICLIPCYDRPEFLFYTLKQIEKAKLSDKLEYWFLADHGFNPEILKIIDQFKYSSTIIKNSVHAYHPTTKLSRNILQGYKKAYQTKAKYVFLIEDDIMIGKDFFKMHYAIQEKEDVFCSIMSENHNTLFNVVENNNYYYTSQNGDYQSIGVCFKRQNLKQILEYYNIQYLKYPVKVIYGSFPKSKIGKQYVEQAGLIRRVIEKNNHKVAFPHVPRCYHAGFYGKNRGKKIKGPLHRRIVDLKNIIFSDKNMELMTGGGRYFEDSRPINLNTDFEDIELKQCDIIKKPKYKYKFSIVMASYLGQYKDAATNRESKFIRAVKSVIDQSFKDWQLVIISDGCDKTVNLYKKHFSMYSNIDCYKISKQKIWSGNVRQVGLEKSQGRYIIYLDSDDYYGENHLELVNKKLKKYDWIYYDDIDISSGIKKIKHARGRSNDIEIGRTTTSSICHKSSLKSSWHDLGTFKHDINFIKRLCNETDNYDHVGQCEYHVCHWAHSKSEF